MPNALETKVRLGHSYSPSQEGNTAYRALRSAGKIEQNLSIVPLKKKVISHTKSRLEVVLSFPGVVSNDKPLLAPVLFMAGVGDIGNSKSNSVMPPSRQLRRHVTYYAAKSLPMPQAAADILPTLHSGQPECPSPYRLYENAVRDALYNAFVACSRHRLQYPGHYHYGQSKDALDSSAEKRNAARHCPCVLERYSSPQSQMAGSEKGNLDDRKQLNRKQEKKTSAKTKGATNKKES